jgi:hypothetical protein
MMDILAPNSTVEREAPTTIREQDLAQYSSYRSRERFLAPTMKRVFFGYPVKG